MTIKTVLDTNILVPGIGNPLGAPAKIFDRWVDGQAISEKLHVCKDQSDNVFIETATAGNASYLVTKNIKHFPFKRYQQVEIVRVSKFLTRLEKEFG